MVDVGKKSETEREASACGRIRMSAECFKAVCESAVKKGDVTAVARIAGIMGAKKTSDIIPLCHPLSLTKCTVDFIMHEQDCEIEAVCTVKCTGRTGVEMEALSGVSAALLTVYDMCKAIDRSMTITDIHLEEKKGGKSGHFVYGRENGK